MVGEIVETDRGPAKVVAVEWGAPVIERLPGLSDPEMMGQAAFVLASGEISEGDE